MGVGRLMEFLGNVVPFVDEMPKVHNTRGVEVAPVEDAPTSVYFFKTGIEPHIGEVQCSLWPEAIAAECAANRIQLL